MAVGIDLEKGQSSVYLQYELGGETIGARNFEARLEKDLVVVGFELHPVDGNQRMDESRLHSETLKEIHLSDEYIIDNLDTFLRGLAKYASRLEVHITSTGKSLKYAVTFGATGMNFLPLLVEPLAG